MDCWFGLAKKSVQDSETRFGYFRLAEIAILKLCPLNGLFRERLSNMLMRSQFPIRQLNNKNFFIFTLDFPTLSIPLVFLLQTSPDGAGIDRRAMRPL